MLPAQEAYSALEQATAASTHTPQGLSQVSAGLAASSAVQNVSPQLAAQSPTTNAAAPDEQVVISVGPDGYCAKGSRDIAPRRITNWYISRFETVHSVCLSETIPEEKRRIACDIVVFDDGMSEPRVVHLSIGYSELDSLCSTVQKNDAAAYVSTKQTAILHALTVFFRHQMAKCTNSFEYLTSGWAKLPAAGWAYIDDMAQPPVPNAYYRSGFRFLRGPRREETRIIEDGLGLLRISNDPAPAAILLLWSALAVSFSMFDEAGHRPTSLLFINGPSGSLKTATAKLVFDFSGNDSQFYTTFRSTVCSMEELLGDSKDRVLLLDDFCPASDGKASAEMQNTLEKIVRYYGDGKARGRSSPGGTVSEKRVGGLCAITGEATAGSYSSLLRCLFLPVAKNTINSEALAYYQREPWRWTEFLALFTAYLAPRFGQIVDMIKARFPTLRMEASGVLRELRLVDICAALLIEKTIVLDMVQHYGGNVQELDDLFTNAVIETCRNSEMQAQQLEPTRFFAEVITTILNRGDMRLAPSVSAFEVTPFAFLGVEKDGYWYLWRDKAYRALCQYCSNLHIAFPLKEKALWQKLADDLVLLPTVIDHDGKTTVEFGTKVSFANRPRMLMIDPGVLMSYADPDANSRRP